MNDILLINRIDPQDPSKEKRKIFFLLGYKNIPYIDEKLTNLFKRTNIVPIKDIIYKYNGIELNITIQQIPKIIKLLTEENISIYSVFEIYNPKL